MKECIEVTGIDHCNCFFRCSHALVNEVACDLHCSLSGSLTVSCLEHVELTVLNRELHILHVTVVLLEDGAYFSELLECLRELLLHLSDLHRSTNACNNVLALSVCQELTEEALVTCCRVTCESNTGTAIVTHVTESHGLYVNSCTPGIRDIVVTTVNVGTRVVPGTEYGFDRAHELFLRICREVGTDLCLILGLELVSQFLEVISGELNVLLHALFSLHLIDEFFEVLLTNFHYDVGVHLDKSSVAVPSPARVIGLFCDYVNNFLIETEV